MGPQLALTAIWISHRGAARRALPSLWGCERLKGRVEEEEAGEGRGPQNREEIALSFKQPCQWDSRKAEFLKA